MVEDSQNLYSISFMLTYIIRAPVINPDDPEDETEALIRVIASLDCLRAYGREVFRKKPIEEQMSILTSAYINTSLNGENRVRDFKRTDDYIIVKTHWDTVIWCAYKAGLSGR